MENSNIKYPSECRILIVDDDKNLCDMLKDTLKEKYQVESCYSAKEAFLNIKAVDYDIVVTDLKLDDGSGIDVLKSAKEKDKHTEVIIITGYGTLETASEAINLGVTSYLNKPFKISDFHMQVEKAYASRIFHLKSLRLITHSDYTGILDVKEHILDITSLYYITSKFMLSLDVPEVMRMILEEINEKLDTLYSVIGVNFLKFSEVFVMPKVGEINAADVVKSILSVWDDSFKVFLKEDFENEKVSLYVYHGKQNMPEIDNTSFGNVISLPMTILGETIGFIALFLKDKKSLDKERNRFFYVFTSLITSAIQHCYMDMLAKQQAKTDSLTGVANHRMFHESLERELARSHRNKRQFCFAMIDIDDFKKINDNYGHMVGDAVLIDLTKRISDTIRGGDVLARYGGEEFTIILHDTDLSGAEILAKRVCEVISKTPFVFTNSEIYYTISIGLVAYDCDTPPKKNVLIGLADEALYTAKRNGKNRVEVG